MWYRKKPMWYRYFRCGIGIFPLRAFSDTTSEIISNRVRRKLFWSNSYINFGSTSIMNQYIVFIFKKFWWVEKFALSFTKRFQVIWILNRNESESFVRLAPSFTFVSQKFVFIERIHCVYKILKHYCKTHTSFRVRFAYFSLLSYKLTNETNVKVGAKRTNSSLFSNEFLSPYF
jgi:hypothetical protein